MGCARVWGGAVEVPSPQEQGSGMLMRVGRILGRNVLLFDVILCVDVCDTVMRQQAEGCQDCEWTD